MFNAAAICPFFRASCCADGDKLFEKTTPGMDLIALNTILLVSQPCAIANFWSGILPTLIDPKTTIKMIGNNSEKTIDVGLLMVASKLYLETAKAAFTWLAGLLMRANIKYCRSI